MEDTGERMIPEAHRGMLVYGEHISRYKSIRSLVENRVVLDVACGSGYGTDYIAQSAQRVVGVDISAEAIDYAKTNFSSPNTEFVVGSATDLNFQDGTFDTVVSFETIEHIADYRTYLSEVSRVLKPEGWFILSTPNDREYPKGNHFHIHEFNIGELEKLLGKYFSHISIYYQGNWLYTGLFDRADFEGEWTKTLVTEKAVHESALRALYFVVVCSNQRPAPAINLTPVLAEPWYAKDQIQSELDNRDQKMTLEQKIFKTQKKVALVQSEKDQLENRLLEIERSRAWRIAVKLRTLYRHIIPAGKNRA